MFGVDDAAKIVEDMSEEAIEILKGMGSKADFLVELTKYLIKREN